ncbi:uncharacterized protein LOC117503605 [Thalassophryne amazonica]|uniref:uncharacterized protein LOC117503605 n=1 Tax=Thalassophryne amazonica TaxID=390379 RepID=UPI001472599D|nr:uncharacterized protein LOC117503605 [Thalassophryne amazonica]XP_034018753.1 uncharacterized protein LOC117503605 [Thalassophryne amazonica]
MMDLSTIWQWRIVFGKNYSRRPEPFMYCQKTGLDFNVGSNNHKKLGLQHVTNGVVLEIFDFAKSVSKLLSKPRIILQILENNFDVSFENEEQRSVFSSKLGAKISDLKKRPTRYSKKPFNFGFFFSECKNCKVNLNMASSELTEGISVKMEEPNTDDGEDEKFEFECSQVSCDEYIKIENVSEEMDGTHADVSEHGDQFACSGEPSAEELKEGLPLSFPLCNEIGVKFGVESKQSLDPGLVTQGVLLELARFSRLVMGSYLHIVIDMLEHNFEVDLRNLHSQLLSKIKRLDKRHKKLLNKKETKEKSHFHDQLFSFAMKKRPPAPSTLRNSTSQYQFKEVTQRRQSEMKRKLEEQEETALVSTSEQVTKKRRKRPLGCKKANTNVHKTFVCTLPVEMAGDYYTRPLGESDADSDEQDVL